MFTLYDNWPTHIINLYRPQWHTDHSDHSKSRDHEEPSHQHIAFGAQDVAIENKGYSRIRSRILYVPDEHWPNEKPNGLSGCCRWDFVQSTHDQDQYKSVPDGKNCSVMYKADTGSGHKASQTLSHFLRFSFIPSCLCNLSMNSDINIDQYWLLTVDSSAKKRIFLVYFVINPLSLLVSVTTSMARSIASSREIRNLKRTSSKYFPHSQSELVELTISINGISLQSSK